MSPNISNEKYVRLTSFRKNGTPVSLPVWIADLGDGTVGFTTASSSYKVKRINNNPRVTLQPSDSRGNGRPGSDEVEGTARLGTGAEFDQVKAAIKSKYGLQFMMISLIGLGAKLIGRGSGTDTAVIVTLDEDTTPN